MKKLIILTLSFSFIISFSNAQKVRWPYALNNDSYGAGVPWEWGKGAAEYYPGYYVAKKDKKKNTYFHYQFMPFEAQQLMIMEVIDHPISIREIRIGYLPKGEKKSIQKVIYAEDNSQSMHINLNILNIGFQPTKNITDVWIYFNSSTGTGRIAGIALTDFPEPYTPKINLLPGKPFEDELLDMNEDVIHESLGEFLSPTGPVITMDGKTIYFTSMVKDLEKQIYDYKTTADEGFAKIFEAKIADDGRIAFAQQSNYNLDTKVSTFSALTAVADNGKQMYINTMDTDRKLVIYRVYVTIDKDGYSKYNLVKLKLGKYDNVSDYINDIMSSDKEYLIVTMQRKDKFYRPFERDLYVAKRIKEDQYGEFIRLGDDINTIGDEVPCFLSPDNKTFFFASNGHLGYGQKDIYVSKRLDDTWQNWSQPINLGPIVNSAGTENYFIVDSKGGYAYVVKWGKDKEGFSDLFRVKINPPRLEDRVTQTLSPD